MIFVQHTNGNALEIRMHKVIMQYKSHCQVFNNNIECLCIFEYGHIQNKEIYN